MAALEILLLAFFLIFLVLLLTRLAKQKPTRHRKE